MAHFFHVLFKRTRPHNGLVKIKSKLHSLREAVPMDIKKNRTFEARLKDLRQDLIKKRLGTEESWQNLHENEIEFEEKATNEQLATGLKQLDDQDRKKIDAINYALGRIQSDNYDICESCGENISEKRLEAVPWTTICIDCAAEIEEGRAPAITHRQTWSDTELDEELETGEDELEIEEDEDEDEDEVELPMELEGFSDKQLESAVYDALREDGRITIEELVVSCHNKKLRLSGSVPDKKHLSHLREIVYDELGFKDVEEVIKVDSIPWQRNDRTPDLQPEEDEEDDSIEGESLETIEAIKEGKSIAPADEIIPETSRRGKR